MFIQVWADDEETFFCKAEDVKAFVLSVYDEDMGLPYPINMKYSETGKYKKEGVLTIRYDFNRWVKDSKAFMILPNKKFSLKLAKKFMSCLMEISKKGEYNALNSFQLEDIYNTLKIS